MDDTKIAWPHSWSQTAEFYKPGTSGVQARVATVTVGFSIDDTAYVLCQKKDMGWPIMPGGKTCFGGQVEEGESCAEAANRELREELGDTFVDNIVAPVGLTEVFDVCSRGKSGETKCQRAFYANLGQFTYMQWLEKQRLISLGEGIGVEAVSMMDLERDFAKDIYVPGDRDTLGMILQLL